MANNRQRGRAWCVRYRDELQRAGYTAAICEVWNPVLRSSSDLFGVADLIAWKEDCQPILVQVTARAAMSARHNKILTVAPGIWSVFCFQIVGFDKQAGKWRRKVDFLGADGQRVTVSDA